jgi:MFS family permease
VHQVTTHTFLLALLHLLVDGVCASGVMIISRHLINDVEADGIIVLYDLLAFGTQPLTGRWMDSRGVHPFGFKLAMVLLICGALLCSLTTSIIRTAALVGTILLGMGNSFFHVYGGKYVAVVSHNDIRALGVFVSTGAVGLAIGIGFSSRMLLAAFLLVLLVLSALHLYSADKQMTDMSTGVCCLVMYNRMKRHVRSASYFTTDPET